MSEFTVKLPKCKSWWVECCTEFWQIIRPLLILQISYLCGSFLLVKEGVLLQSESRGSNVVRVSVEFSVQNRMANWASVVHRWTAGGVKLSRWFYCLLKKRSQHSLCLIELWPVLAFQEGKPLMLFSDRKWLKLRKSIPSVFLRLIVGYPPVSLWVLVILQRRPHNWRVQ